jgi:hypothetical protein
VIEEISKLALSTIRDVLEIKDGELIMKDHAELSEDVLATVASVEEVINDKGHRSLQVKARGARLIGQSGRHMVTN